MTTTAKKLLIVRDIMTNEDQLKKLAANISLHEDFTVVLQYCYANPNKAGEELQRLLLEGLDDMADDFIGDEEL